MPLLNDLLDFNDHPLIPPPSAQLLPNICPLSGCSIAFSFHPCHRQTPSFAGDMVVGWWSAWRFSAMNPLPRLFAALI